MYSGRVCSQSLGCLLLLYTFGENQEENVLWEGGREREELEVLFVYPFVLLSENIFMFY